MGKAATAAHIRKVCDELRTMALAADLEFIALLLSMVSLQASKTAILDGAADQPDEKIYS